MTQDTVSTSFKEFLGQPGAECFRLGSRATPLALDNFAAIRGANQSTQPDPVAVDLGIPGDRHLAATHQAGIQRAFGRHLDGGDGIGERGQQGVDPRVIDTALDPDRPLADGRQALLRAEQFADALTETET